MCLVFPGVWVVYISGCFVFPGVLVVLVLVLIMVNLRCFWWWVLMFIVLFAGVGVWFRCF